MNVIEIPEAGKRVEYPSTWEELNRGQLLFIVRQALLLMAGEMSVLEFKVRVFYFLTGIKRKRKHNRKDRYLTREEMERKYGNIVLAAETVSFVFSGREGELVFDFDCVKNLLPKVRSGWRVYHGPGDALLNVTFGEYMVAYDFYRRYMMDKEERDLNALCAVLYRPKRKRGVGDDCREEFNVHECVRRAGRFSRLSFEERFVILSWFSSCDNYFKSGEIEVDGRAISLGVLFRQEDKAVEGEGDDPGLGLTGILLGVAENGAFGTIEEVKRTNLYTVMLRLYLWHLENKRLEKMYKDGKSK